MDFTCFCNICHSEDTRNLQNICEAETQYLKDALISCIGHAEIVNNSAVYLCWPCCEKLLEYNNFKEKCFRNFVHVKQRYIHLQSKMSSEGGVNIQRKLSKFLHAKITTPSSGTTNRNVITVNLSSDTDYQSERTTDNIITIDEGNGSNNRSTSSEVSETINLDDDDDQSLSKFSIEIKDEIIELGTYEIENESTNMQENINWDSDLIETNEYTHSVQHSQQTDTSTQSDDNVLETSLLQLLNNSNQEKASNKENIPQKSRKRKGMSESDGLSNLKIIETFSLKVSKQTYSCQVCGEEFADALNLISHKRTHEQDGLFRCHYCKKTSSTAYGMKLHLATTHKYVTDFYKCPGCKKKFSLLISLEKHLRSFVTHNI